jgi:hypothetical protein
MTDNKQEFTITTPIFRVSFPSLATKKDWGDGKDPKYEVRMLFPKKPEPWMEQLCPGDSKRLDALRALCAKAAHAKFGDKKVPGIKKPIKDGDTDERAREGEQGYFFASATSKYEIVCVDQGMNVLIGPDAIRECIYAGCWARASIRVSAFDQLGGKGVSFHLQGIQKVRDGERLTSSFAADTAFEAIAGAAPSTEDVKF